MSASFVLDFVNVNRRTARCVGAACLFAFWAPVCAAADGPPPPAPGVAQAREVDAGGVEAARPSHRHPAAAPERRGPQDPLEMLRERLAQKLGAVKTPDPANPNVVRIETKASDAAASAAPRTPAVHREAHRKPSAPHLPQTFDPATRPARWDYVGSGNPEEWGRLDPRFAKCSSGTRQSPIDIHDGIKVDLDSVDFHYQPSGFKVIDNGHTVQVDIAPGNSIDVMGRHYQLVQFEFHRPAEERVNGKPFDMSVHLVHKDSEGRVAIIAVLLEKGSVQGVVQSVWNNLPLEKGDEVIARGQLNPSDMLPPERGYYTYMGSLTAPPCSEGVLWMVMKQPVPVSAEQVDIFARLYPMNARPIQATAGRLIKQSR